MAVQPDQIQTETGQNNQIVHPTDCQDMKKLQGNSYLQGPAQGRMAPRRWMKGRERMMVEPRR